MSPRSVPLFEAKTPSLDERKAALDFFREVLDLGDTRTVDLADSIAFAGKRGEVEFFPASGAIWARDAEAEQAHENEMRKWPGLEEIRGDNDVILGLGRQATGDLVKQAREVFERAELTAEQMKPVGVALEQVSQLSERGEILERGAGAASVMFGYELEGLSVFGAGAKSQVFAEPAGRGTRVVGAFHCWRPAGAGPKVELGSVEDALAAGVLDDPELTLYKEKGGRIEVTKLEFGYMALPAMFRQRHVFPVFQIEGRVDLSDDREQYFEFGRYHHAAHPKRYAEAGVFADYLVRTN